MTLNESDFEDLQQVLSDFESVHGAAEAHGALCGILGFMGATGKAQWIAWLLQDADTSVVSARDGIVFLDSFYDRACENLVDESFGFGLLLPEDESALYSRINALASWCDGFVFGLGFGGVLKELDGNEEVDELVSDLIRISQTDGEGASSEADEADFAEVVEYVRVAVLNLQEIAQSIEQNKKSNTGH